MLLMSDYAKTFNLFLKTLMRILVDTLKRVSLKTQGLFQLFY